MLELMGRVSGFPDASSLQSDLARLNSNLETLNELLSDLREMVAPLLGYRVKEDK